MKSRARRGLDALLARYPDAEPAEIHSQRAEVVALVNETLRADLFPILRLSREPGSWTVVDLAAEGELHRFGIWNATGAVYAIDEYGAAGDDPVIPGQCCASEPNASAANAAVCDLPYDHQGAWHEGYAEGPAAAERPGRHRWLVVSVR